ncbi:MAG: antibiotic biosynthesis monooxygenase [Leptolyngbyaceae cyanobacterium bins.59]|nr:antibiotic biosynthesis monooxygenase [Leptolyngbyaceae cyanobacterium bins.59]
MNSSNFPDHHVTAVIAHLVKPGRESAYEAWMRQIIPVAKTFHGHLGVNILRPQAGVHSEYIIILHFDRHENLQVWLNSKERWNLIERTKPLVQESEKIQVLTGLETWFELPNRSLPSPPKRYKMVLLTWMGVFVTLSIVSRILQIVLAPLPIVLTQFLTVGVVVWLLTYLVMPRLTQLFRKWLYSSV